MNNMIFINLSPWPIMVTINLLNLMTNLITNMYSNFNLTFSNKIIIMIIISIMWNFNSSMYKNILGLKNFMIYLSMKMFMIMFILSELMFFITFFYIYLLNKTFNMYFYKNFYLNTFKLNFVMSMMNLMILLTSSLSFMIFIKININKKNHSNKFILMTMILSIYFLMIQFIEYKFMNFNITNSLFFSNFFLLTLFHMMHVILGTLMMIVITMNKMLLLNNQFTQMMNTCWYWHFIDFIWILIFFIIY